MKAEEWAKELKKKRKKNITFSVSMPIKYFDNLVKLSDELGLKRSELVRLCVGYGLPKITRLKDILKNPTKYTLRELLDLV